MDQALLVRNGHHLLDALAQKGMPARAALWVHDLDVDSWRLWIVPPKSVSNKHEFYRKVSEVISENGSDLAGTDASDTEMISETHPAIQGLSQMFHVSGKSSIHLKNSLMNGFYLPDGIILHMEL